MFPFLFHHTKLQLLLTCCCRKTASSFTLITHWAPQCPALSLILSMLFIDHLNLMCQPFLYLWHLVFLTDVWETGITQLWKIYNFWSAIYNWIWENLVRFSVSKTQFLHTSDRQSVPENLTAFFKILQLSLSSTPNVLALWIPYQLWINWR